MNYVFLLLACILFNFGTSFSRVFNHRKQKKETFIARYEKTAIKVTSEKENSEILPTLLMKRSGRFNVSYLFEFWCIFESCYN